MIYGIGTDICDIRRIQTTLERQGERFAAKILHPTEYAIWQQRTQQCAQRGIRYVATRFAAKEAFSKAIGLGMQTPMTWHDCEIGNHPSGKPCIVLHGALKTWWEAQNWVAHLTLSDEADYAVGFCVIEYSN
ncbi:MAG: hypothetical protein RLZZ495_666 [Pseudomonadota bacterium]|jgi:holo-[acyl-carrier protein] synthase